MADRIAIINLGWSDDYKGSDVVGAFKFLQQGQGHERYNFQTAPDGSYYAHVPPLGQQVSPPKPAISSGWLVFAVSKKPGEKGMRVVGWYEDATFIGAYRDRPDRKKLGRDSDGNWFSYALKSQRAVSIPPLLRDCVIEGDHLKRSYAYLRGGRKSDPWRELLARQLLKYRRYHKPRSIDMDAGRIEARSGICGDPARRKKVERAAIRKVKAAFKRAYRCRDRQKDKCGYDLKFTHRGDDHELHIEVKGTALEVPHFMLSRNERAYADKLAINDKPRKRGDGDPVPPLWKLAIVTDALVAPKLQVLTHAEMQQTFDFEVICWHATKAK